MSFLEGRLPTLCWAYPWKHSLDQSQVRCRAHFRYFFTFSVFLLEIRSCEKSCTSHRGPRERSLNCMSSSLTQSSLSLSCPLLAQVFEGYPVSALVITLHRSGGLSIMFGWFLSFLFFAPREWKESQLSWWQDVSYHEPSRKPSLLYGMQGQGWYCVLEELLCL